MILRLLARAAVTAVVCGTGVLVLGMPASASDPVILGTLSPLLGTSATGVHVVTYGQTAAWSIRVENKGGNSVNHLVLTDAVDNGTFLSSDNPACAVSGSVVT